MEPNIILLTPYAGTAETNHLQEHIAAAGFTCTQFLETSAALKYLTSNSICAIVAKLGQSEKDYPMPLIQAAQLKNPQIFNCIFSSTAVRNAVLRTNCCENGANMVTNNFDTLDEALKIVKEFITKSGTYACPMCGGGALDEDRLQRHTFLYHNQSRARKFTCPVCVKETSPYAVHLFNKHGPAGRHECLAENEMTVRNTYTFTLLVCQRKSDGKFLLVQEVASWGWWLPGGRINQNEDLIQSALRETKEEAGIDAKITGILRFEYNAREEDARMRVIFYGEPIDESQEPKTLPDFESMGAAWVDVSQLQKLPLRSHEPTDWFTYVQQGGTIYPISMLTHEGAPPPLTAPAPAPSKKK